MAVVVSVVKNVCVVPPHHDPIVSSAMLAEPNLARSCNLLAKHNK